MQISVLVRILLCLCFAELCSMNVKNSIFVLFLASICFHAAAQNFGEDVITAFTVNYEAGYCAVNNAVYKKQGLDPAYDFKNMSFFYTNPSCQFDLFSRRLLFSLKGGGAAPFSHKAKGPFKAQGSYQTDLVLLFGIGFYVKSKVGIFPSVQFSQHHMRLYTQESGINTLYSYDDASHYDYFNSISNNNSGPFPENTFMVNRAIRTFTGFGANIIIPVGEDETAGAFRASLLYGNIKNGTFKGKAFLPEFSFQLSPHEDRKYIGFIAKVGASFFNIHRVEWESSMNNTEAFPPAKVTCFYASAGITIPILKMIAAISDIGCCGSATSNQYNIQVQPLQ